MGESILKEKSYSFALRIVRLVKYFAKEKREFILGKQILRSGTAIGALVRESEFAESKADFIHKLHIALKEAVETDYWLSLLNDSDYIDDKAYQSIKTDCGELIALLVTSIKTAKKRRVKNE